MGEETAIPSTMKLNPSPQFIFIGVQAERMVF